LSQLVRAAAAAGGDHREVADRPAPRNEVKVLIERWRKAHNVDGGWKRRRGAVEKGDAGWYRSSL